MDADKLKQIVADQNADREYDTVRDARCIIEEIIELNAKKVRKAEELKKFNEDTDKQIAELRSDLKKLTVKTVDPAEVLGELAA